MKNLEQHTTKPSIQNRKVLKNKITETLDECVSKGILDSQFAQSLVKLINVFVDGVIYGHFDVTAKGIIGKGKRREVIIETGKLFKFNIPVSELP